MNNIIISRTVHIRCCQFVFSFAVDRKPVDRVQVEKIMLAINCLLAKYVVYERKSDEEMKLFTTPLRVFIFDPLVYFGEKNNLERKKKEHYRISLSTQRLKFLFTNATGLRSQFH